MRPRAVRLGLLAVILAVGASVALTYRRGSPTAAEPSPAAMAGGSLPAARTENLVFRSFRKDEQAFALTAREMVGKEHEQLHLQGVALNFGYTVKGKPQTGTITADESHYEPAQQKAVFRGAVRVTSGEGFELLSDALTYRGDRSLVRSEQPVQFRRKDLSGRAKGVSYDAAAGRLELLADVSIQLRDPDNAPMDVSAGHALLLREQGVLTLSGGVTVNQGGDVLRSRQLVVEFAGEDAARHMQALDDVELRTGGGPATHVAQNLSCRKLDLMFRPDRSLAEAVAGQAEVALPPAAGRPEQRRLGGRTLAFSFDERGRLFSLRGQQGTTFTVIPATGSPRVLRSQRFVAQLDPATGATQWVEFEDKVEFEEGSRKGSSQKARYDDQGVFTLQPGAQLVDEKQGVRLRAQAIEVATDTGNLAARHNVRHVQQSRAGAGLFKEPIIVTSRSFEYVNGTKEAHYWPDVLLRSGRTEVRAADIRLRETEGRNRLEAGGGVKSRLESPPDKDDKRAQPVQGSARSLTYDEKAGVAVYRGDAVIVQGDVTVRGPEAKLTFSEEGKGLKSLEAGEPVEIQQGRRHVSGRRGSYTPGDGTLMVVGDKVVLRDEGQVVQGRKVTFHVGDERVLVDGGEQVRTETVFRRAPPKP